MHGTQVLDSSARPASALPTPFACSWTRHGDDAAWVRLAGELDMATSPRLERTLSVAQQQARLVVVDLRLVAFLDCSAIRALVDASIRARRERRRLVILRGPPHVDRVFALAGMSDVVEFVDELPARTIVADVRHIGATSGKVETVGIEPTSAIA